MTHAVEQVTTDMLQAFADAWNRHDADAIMSFMTSDCVFEASDGPDVTVVGRTRSRFMGDLGTRAISISGFDLSVDDLIRNKLATGRAKALADVDSLRSPGDAA